MLEFGEFLPDLPTFQGGAGEAVNVFPYLRGYRPMPSLQAYSTTAMTARCRGAAYFRATDGSAKQFAGDATKLYILSSLAWTDASRTSGGAYATASTDGWDFAQFGSLIIAVNGTDVPQKFTLDSSTNFAALGGSPPTGPRFVEVMGDFVVFGRLPSAVTTVQWSAINDAESWAASAETQADSQVLPDGGAITGLIGWEYGGLVFQDRIIRRMDYEGSPIIFRFKQISSDVGCSIPGTLARFGDLVIFAHRSGFYRVVGGSQLEPIGAGKIDRYFWADIDTSNLHRVSSAIDPVNNLYAVSYPSQSAGGVPDKMLIWHWPSGRWSRAEPGALELIYSGTSQASYTLDQLDTVNASLDALTASLDDPIWAGTPQPLLAGFNTSHNLGYFNGTNLAATIDTQEGELSPGRLTLVRSLRSSIEGSSVTPSVALGTRNRLNDAVSYGTTRAQDSQGKHDFRSNARYHRARVTIPAADAWTYALGVDVIDAQATGRR